MHAIEIAETGGPDVLNDVERRRPAPDRGEVLNNAEAVGVNFIDTYFRGGLYPRELPFILGSEVCGTGAAVGEDVVFRAGGDRVANADAVGTSAEYCLAPVDLSTQVPDVVPAETAASALLKGLTARFLINSVYPIRAGGTVLVHAGAGGVGLILTQ